MVDRRRVIRIVLIAFASPCLIGTISLPVFAVGPRGMTPALQPLATMPCAKEVRGGMLGVSCINQPPG